MNRIARRGLCVLGFGLASALQAQVIVWSGASTNRFVTGANWAGGVAPGPANTAQFGNAGGFATVMVNSTTIGSLEFLSSRTVTTLSYDDGVSTLTLNGNLTVQTGPNVTFTNAMNLALAAGEHVVDIGASTSLWVAGVISGAGHFTKAGTGTLLLTGTNTFNYTGGFGFTNSTAIKAGTLQLDLGGSINHTGTGDITIGDASGDNGTLLIYGGSSASDYFGVIGQSAGSMGAVTVSGAGSTWTNSAGLNVGYSGTGTLDILAGGVVSTDNGTIGENSGSSGDVLISGNGSLLSNTNYLVVGVAGTGTLTATNGGDVTGTNTTIGSSSSGIGTVTIDGTGTGMSNASSLYVGGSGTGTLNITGGGSVGNDFGIVGQAPGSSGTVAISGNNSTWYNTQDLYVGDSGTGILTVSTGGDVSNLNGHLGYAAGSSGTATIDGAGSTWSNAGHLTVGNGGDADLIISNGGFVSNASATISTSNTSVSSVAVNGGTWTNSSLLLVGDSGNGDLSITNGGDVTNSHSNVGNLAGGVGTVTVDGAGSTWGTASILYIGASGTGTLTVLNGGAVTSDFSNIGWNVSANGSVTVTGSGSSLAAATEFDVGYSGTGSLNILAGGTVNAPNSYMGNNAGASGTALVAGTDSLWNNGNSAVIGYGGSGVLTLQDGGKLQANAGAGWIFLGGVSGGSGVLNLGAAGADAAAAGGIVNAASITTGAGTGIVQFNTTATTGSPYYFTNTGAIGGTPVTVTGSTSLINTAGYSVLTGANTYTGGTTVNGGTLSVSSVANGGSASSIGASTNAAANLVLHGGTLRYTGSGATTDRLFTLGTNGGILDSSGSGVLTFGNTGALALDGSNTPRSLTLTGSNTSPAILYSTLGDNGSGATALVKSGPGLWVLGNANTYTGGTTITGGTLTVINTTGSATGTGDISISSGAGLQVSGAVSGNIINNGQTYFSTSSPTTYSGVISGTGLVANSNVGTLTLSGINTYSGITNVIAGAVADGIAGAFSPNSSVTLAAGTGLNVNFNETIKGLTGDGGTATIAGGATLTVNGNASGSYSGVITGAGALAKTGTSYWTITGNNTYTGSTLIKDGILALDGGSITQTFNGPSTLMVGDTEGDDGTLEISNGGDFLNINSSVLGNATGSSGTVTVTGAGSTWINSFVLRVGESGTGYLDITDGGSVANTTGYVGVNSGSIGSVTVDAGTWTNSDYLYVGLAGDGALEISNGGSVTSSATSVGNNFGGVGILMLDGVGSSLVNTGNLYVGSEGMGLMMIEGGASATNVIGSVGNNADGESGSVGVIGIGSTWTNTGALIVGNATSGYLMLDEQGTVTADSLNVGVNVDASGIVILQEGSSLSVANNLVSGGSGYSNLSVYSGSDVATGGYAVIGNNADSIGGVFLEGTGTTFSVGGDIYIGNAGSGTLYVRDGAVVTTAGGSGVIRFGHTGGDGEIYLGYDGEGYATGGILNASSITTESGSGLLVFGTTSSAAAPYYLTKDGTSGGVGVTIDGATIVAQEGGYNVLKATSTYTGGTLIYSGTLVAGTDGALGTGGVTVYGGKLGVAPGVVLSNPLTLNSGASLTGNGTFGSAITVGGGVHLAPGDSPGTLTFSNGLTLADGGFLDMEVQFATGAAGTGYDTVAVSGGALDLAAVSAGGFTLKLISLNLGGGAGDVSDFSFTNSYSWTVFSTSGITGFDANKFTLDLSGFSNELSIGSFVFSQSGNNVLLNFTAVPEPSTYALLALGLGASGLAAWRKRRRA